MRYVKLYESFEDINQICKKYGIRNYTIIGDGSIDVEGNVNLTNKSLNKLPVSFGHVSGNFFCSYNKLTSLEGCPKSVGCGLYCTWNKLTSLEGFPNAIGGDFYCDGNRLTSLEGCYLI